MSQLDRLWHRGKAFLGTEVPVIAGAMTWISDAPFVAAVANAGAFGSLAGGNMEPSALADEIRRTRDLTDKPFAVNLITISPNYRAHLDAAVKRRVPFIVFGGSFPRKPEIQRGQGRRSQGHGLRSDRIPGQASHRRRASTPSSWRAARPEVISATSPWGSSSSRSSSRSTRSRSSSPEASPPAPTSPISS